MPTPPETYVPWTFFEWFMAVYGTVLASIGSVLFWFFKKHLRDDDRRFEMAEANIQLKHAENIASMQQLRGDLLQGQSSLAQQFTSIRRTLDDVLLQRRMEPRE
jgi:hypothetical protein